MKKHEYKIIEIAKKSKFSMFIDPGMNEVALTELGLEGWRLSHVLTYGGTTTHYVMERDIKY